MAKITARQQNFIDAYLTSGNSAQAARQAGYSERGANVTASRLLANDNVSAEIGRRLEEVRSLKIASVEETLELATAILRGVIEEQTALVVGTGKSSRIEIIDTPPKVRDRLKAAEFLHKVLSASNSKEPVTEIVITCAEKPELSMRGNVDTEKFSS